MLCGGTSDTHEATEEIQALIEQVRSKLEAIVGSSFPHFKAISYKSQLVAGTNYFVKIDVGNDKYFHVRIFKSLPHAGSTVEVHSHQAGKTRDDAIEYF